MNMRPRTPRWVVAALAITVAGCTAGPGGTASPPPAATDAPAASAPTTAAPSEITIGFAISSFRHDFLVTLGEAAEEAAAANGAKVIIADADADTAKQASQVEDFITQGVDVIVLNPVDADAIVPSVEAANTAGIPVLTVDRGATGGTIASHIASDNIFGGVIAGEFLFKAIGTGQVIELEGVAGTTAARDRGAGFQQALDAASGIERVAKQTANFRRDEGLSVTQNLLQAHPEVKGLFAHNDDMALGAIEAIAAAGAQDSIIVVGFDAAPDAVQAVKDGKMAATVAQQPALMARIAIEKAVAVAKGESVEAEIPIEVTLVTKENADQY